MNFAAHLRDIVTIWPIVGQSEYAGYIFGAPYTLRARWQDEQVKFVNGEGEEVVSRATAVLSRPVNVLDYIARGDLTHFSSPLEAGSAIQIRGFSRVTNLRNTQQINQVFL